MFDLKDTLEDMLILMGYAMAGGFAAMSAVHNSWWVLIPALFSGLIAEFIFQTKYKQ